MRDFSNYVAQHGLVMRVVGVDFVGRPGRHWMLLNVCRTSGSLTRRSLNTNIRHLLCNKPTPKDGRRVRVRSKVCLRDDFVVPTTMVSDSSVADVILFVTIGLRTTIGIIGKVPKHSCWLLGIHSTWYLLVTDELHRSEKAVTERINLNCSSKALRRLFSCRPITETTK